MEPLKKSNIIIGKHSVFQEKGKLVRGLIGFLIAFLFFSENLFAFALYTKTICSGSPVNFVPAGNSSFLTYTWDVPLVVPAGSVNATQQSTPQSGVNQILTNTTTAIAKVTYTVTASDASTFTLEVTINPTPVLTNSTANTAICSGATFAYTSASATTGTTITWSRALTNGITPNTNNGNDNISEALSNTTSNSLTATYMIVLTANGCTNTQNLSVLVNPTPTLNTTLSPAAVCSGSSFVYSPGSNQSPNINYAWTRAAVAGISNANSSGTNSPNETLLNTTLAAVPVNYVYTLTNTATGCTNSQTVSVNVNPLPALSSSTSNVSNCSGVTFNYLPTSALGGTAISWTRASIPGISPNSGLGNGNISEVLVNNSNLTPVTATYQFTLSNAGCSNTQNFKITVNAKPMLSTNLFPSGICSGNQFVYTPNSVQSNIGFAWSRAVVSGISNGAGNGIDNPGETLTNTTLLSIPVVYAYTLTNSITGCTNSQNVTVNVSPIPSLSNSVITSCNNQGFQQYFQTVPSGTTYTWPTPVISPASAITGGAAQAIGLPYVGQTLNNTSGASATATYTVTPNTFGCIGSTFSIEVTVGIVATAAIPISSLLTAPAICSGNKFNYTPTSTAPSPSFTWQRYYAAGISNTLASGTNDPNETLTNTTTLPVTVSYGFTIASGGCASTHTVTVQVNPSTQLNTTLTPAAICSNTVFNYAPYSNTPSTNAFNWTRDAVAGISNGNGAGANNPNETLINTTNAPITVKYVYTLNTSSSCAHIDTVRVIVNPAPSLSSSLIPGSICSGVLFSYMPTSTTTGAIFSWIRPSITGISNPTASGISDPAELLNNTTSNNINVFTTVQLSPLSIG